MVEKAKSEPWHLIDCGNHNSYGKSPWSVVCVHLIEGTSREWIPIESIIPEVDFDWICPKCLELCDDEDGLNPGNNLENLRPVCIHCVRTMRKEFDPNYEE